MRTLFLSICIISPSLLILFIYNKILNHQFYFSLTSVAIIILLIILFLFAFLSFIYYHPDKKQILIKLWLSIIAAFFTYLIVDAIAGFILIPRLSPKMIHDQFVHHKLEPNTYSKFDTPEFSYVQRVNNIGMRGLDISLGKGPNTYRALMLGDSFTMGKGVSDTQTFSNLLQESLNNNISVFGGIRFDVLNGGVDSYSPILSYLQLRQIADSIEPDLVVLNLDMSDLMQEVAYRNEASFGADGIIVGIDGRETSIAGMKFNLTKRIREWNNQNLFVTRLIIFHLDQLNGESDGVATIKGMVTLAHPELLRHTLAEDTVDREEQWQYLFDSVSAIQRFCTEKNIQFLLTIYPWGHQVNDTEWTPGRWVFIPEDASISDKSVHLIEDFAASNGIDILNVFPAFRSYHGVFPLFYNYDLHWTVQGHRVMAGELERFIRANYLMTILSGSKSASG